MLVIGMVLGYKLHDTGDSYDLIANITSDQGLTEYGRVEEVIRFIENKYAYNIGSEELTNDALSAVVQNLDPYSNYIPPSELDVVNNRTSGIYHGLGIESYKKDSSYFITKVYDKSPAQEAGLQLFDEIISINGLNLKDSSYNLYNIKEVLGEYDSLIINIKRENHFEEVALMESDINLSPISRACKIEEDIYYIKVDGFSDGVYRIFMDSIEHLAINNPDHHLIIDLRGNRGGLLPEVANMLSQCFTQKDILLVSTKGEHQKEERYTTTGKPFFRIGNIAVLIDGNSASASEILAGAIQDLDRGIVVGTPSFGKGLVQEQYLLSNNGALRLTVAEYYLPTGRCIQKVKNKSEVQDSVVIEYFTLQKNRPVKSGVGIEPDILIDADNNISDLQLKAIQNWVFEFVRENKNQKSSFWDNQLSDIDGLFNDYMNSEFAIIDTSNTKLVKKELIERLAYYGLFDGSTKSNAIFLMQDEAVNAAMIQLKKSDIFDFYDN